MKKYIPIILLFCIASACKSPTSSASNDGGSESGVPTVTDTISEDMIVSDGNFSKTLTFGIGDNSTDSLDQNLDIEGPPFDPPGAFAAHFIIPNHKLFKDLKSNKSRKIDWMMEFSAEGSRDIELSWDWDINPGELAGTITLQDRLENPKVMVDMLSTKNYSLKKGSAINKLFIVYRNNS